MGAANLTLLEPASACGAITISTFSSGCRALIGQEPAVRTYVFGGRGTNYDKEMGRMEYYCIDKRHKCRLSSLMLEDGTLPGDIERISLFYIIAGNEALYFRRNVIYDFKEHCIKGHMADGGEDFSSGLQALIKLGYNLYNGYSDKYMTPLELFWNLDHKNREIAGKAILLRFNIYPCL